MALMATGDANRTGFASPAAAPRRRQLVAGEKIAARFTCPHCCHCGCCRRWLDAAAAGWPVWVLLLVDAGRCWWWLPRFGLLAAVAELQRLRILRSNVRIRLQVFERVWAGSETPELTVQQSLVTHHDETLTWFVQLAQLIG